VLTASGTAGSTTLTYNQDGRTASVADAAGTTSYTYDSAGRLATLANPVTGTTATYSCNPDSLVSGISYRSGKDTQSFGYDGMRRLTSDALKTSSGTSVAEILLGPDPRNIHSILDRQITLLSTGLSRIPSSCLDGVMQLSCMPRQESFGGLSRRSLPAWHRLTWRTFA
jgi:YD repeat-containing protein